MVIKLNLNLPLLMTRYIHVQPNKNCNWIKTVYYSTSKQLPLLFIQCNIWWKRNIFMHTFVTFLIYSRFGCLPKFITNISKERKYRIWGYQYGKVIFKKMRKSKIIPEIAWNKNENVFVLCVRWILKTIYSLSRLKFHLHKKKTKKNLYILNWRNKMTFIIHIQIYKLYKMYKNFTIISGKIISVSNFVTWSRLSACVVSCLSKFCSYNW